MLIFYIVGSSYFMYIYDFTVQELSAELHTMRVLAYLEKIKNEVHTATPISNFCVGHPCLVQEEDKEKLFVDKNTPVLHDEFEFEINI